jgi:hypothetical protein
MIQIRNLRGTFALGCLLTASLFASVPAGAGKYTRFEVEGWPTLPVSINNPGAIAGYYWNIINGHAYSGFVRGTNGAVTSFDPPGGSGTSVYGINREGAVTGTYEKNGTYGFFRKTDGTITTFDVPGAMINTIASGINDGGVITGQFFRRHRRRQSASHGFVRIP